MCSSPRYVTGTSRYQGNGLCTLGLVFESVLTPFRHTRFSFSHLGQSISHSRCIESMFSHDSPNWLNTTFYFFFLFCLYHVCYMLYMSVLKTMCYVHVWNKMCSVLFCSVLLKNPTPTISFDRWKYGTLEATCTKSHTSLKYQWLKPVQFIWS